VKFGKKKEALPNELLQTGKNWRFGGGKSKENAPGGQNPSRKNFWPVGVEGSKAKKGGGNCERVIATGKKLG